jgi:hypothetical protein
MRLLIPKQDRHIRWMLEQKTTFELEKLRYKKPELRKIIDEILRERWTKTKVAVCRL